ncbi:RNA-binding S4 domain-containing protein [Desulfogranum mediterraneum]|uniref:RNA-binding S4 domain-containing protein n=1 Tax=Desulfogranum mediterraneum TaxID=160661 RepID=UPI001E4723FB|nr:S4 domain-containing protein [Desulfogranum mediterraneum]
MARCTVMEKVRLDKWLWAARFFKTRSLAAKAVSGGHVHVNGQRVKPARLIQIGDSLEIRKGELSFSVEVLGLHDRRGPASQARLLYEESAASMARREELRAERRLITAAAARPDRRPDKRERRKIREFIKKQ